MPDDVKRATRVAPDNWRECPVCLAMVKLGDARDEKVFHAAVLETDLHPDHTPTGWEAGEMYEAHVGG